jgi:hypothetical protein
MPRVPKNPVETVETPTAPAPAQVNGVADLAQALMLLMNQMRPQKKTIADRVPGGPFAAPPGKVKLKLKRKMYLHNVPIDDEVLTNAEIEAFNQLRPGKYFNGLVDVSRRRDRGINIEWPFKGSANQMRLQSETRYTDLADLLGKMVAEGSKPKTAETLLAEDLS